VDKIQNLWKCLFSLLPFLKRRIVNVWHYSADCVCLPLNSSIIWLIITTLHMLLEDIPNRTFSFLSPLTRTLRTLKFFEVGARLALLDLRLRSCLMIKSGYPKLCDDRSSKNVKFSLSNIFVQCKITWHTNSFFSFLCGGDSFWRNRTRQWI
jgi:hypothetical protein